MDFGSANHLLYWWTTTSQEDAQHRHARDGAAEWLSEKERETKEAIAPRWAEIVSGCGGSEGFVIEGDSLIIQYLRNHHGSGGLQPLRAIYFLEKLIGGFRQRSCPITIVFIDDHRVFYRDNYELLALREIVIHHFSSLLPVFRIARWTHSSFRQLLHRLNPSFVMVHSTKDIPETLDRKLTKRGLGLLSSFLLRCRLHIVLADLVDFSGPLSHAFFVKHSSVTPFRGSGEHSYEVFLLIASRALPAEQSALSTRSVQTRERIHGLRSLYNVSFRVAVTLAALQTVPEELLHAHTSVARSILLHTFLLESLPLSARTIRLLHQTTVESDSSNGLLRCWLRHVTDVLFSLPIENTDGASQIVDLFDLHLYRVVLAALSQAPACLIGLPASLETVYQKVCSEVLKLPTVEPSLPSTFDLKFVDAPIFNDRLLPFNRAIISELVGTDIDCGDASLPVDIESARDIARNEKRFLEDHHWHSGKPFDEYLALMERMEESKREREKGFFSDDNRMRQTYIRSIHYHAESLGNVRPEFAPRQTAATVTDSKTKSVDAKGNAKKKTESAADRIRRENSERLKANSKSKDESKFSSMLKELSQLKSHDDQIRYLQIRLADLDSDIEVSLSAYLELLKVYEQKWWTVCSAFHRNKSRDRGADLDMSSAVDLVNHLHLIVRKFGGKQKTTSQSSPDPVLGAFLDEKRKAIDRVMSSFKSLGFDDALESLAARYQLSPKRVKSVRPDVELGDIRPGVSYSRFQMLYMGHLASRDVDARYDPRVSFQPDAWQCQLLDIVDQRQSALVCAPTSAGKTFISYYLMREILRQPTDDILIYVAPTKALVNQVCADVYARFADSKVKPGESVFGIFTRDYRYNDTKCRILVTVPQCLEILLLSPSLQQSWVPRVKYVIFDEVHMIGEEDGSVWEHLLLMLRCPFVALSATVGNPNELATWLDGAQRAYGRKVHLILHKYRFSELRKYIWRGHEEASESSAEKKIDKMDENLLVPIHPASFIDFEDLQVKGIPMDLAFESRDSVRLADALLQAYREANANNQAGIPVELLSLQPEKFFVVSPSEGEIHSCLDISQLAARKYEFAVKDLLSKWCRNAAFADVAKRALQLLTENQRSIEPERFHLIRPALRDELFDLLIHLDEVKLLPAIVFNFERGECERIASHLYELLVSAQEDDESNAQKQQKKSAEKRTSQLKKLHKKLSKAARKNAEVEVPEIEKDSSDPPIEYTFLNPDTKMSTVAIEQLVATKKIRRSKYPLRELKFLALLYRGIGIHHSGLNKSYQQLVEVLFRKGHLRVVIATGTLALGVHMPCRSVIFAGDSQFLNPMQFRQMSGRAGRRGFDSLGHVMFVGVPRSKIRTLLGSPLPELQGHFPLTVTLILRSLMLMKQSPRQTIENIQASLRNLMQQPFFCHGRKHLQQQVYHHFRFSVEYLMREALLDLDGESLTFAGIVSHLYYTEPSNFIFLSVLRSGLFDSVCENFLTDWPSVSVSLMTLLCHIFKRIPLHKKLAKEFGKKSKRQSAPSLVLLPSIPQNQMEVLQSHDSKVLSVFSAYMRTFCKQYHQSLGPDNILPLSNIQISDGATPKFASGSILQTITECGKQTVFARSLFSALSGAGDKFDSLSDLMSGLRSNVILDWVALPTGPFYERQQLNAYIFDFFRHGQIKALDVYNGIREGDIFQHLKDFDLILASIRTSFQEAMPSSRCTGAFTRLADEFHRQFTDAMA